MPPLNPNPGTEAYAEQRVHQTIDEQNKRMHQWNGDEPSSRRRGLRWFLLSVVVAAIVVAIYFLLAHR